MEQFAHPADPNAPERTQPNILWYLYLPCAETAEAEKQSLLQVDKPTSEMAAAAVEPDIKRQRRRPSSASSGLNPLLMQTYLAPPAAATQEEEEEEGEEEDEKAIELGFLGPEDFPFERNQRRMAPLVSEMKALVALGQADGTSDTLLLDFLASKLFDNHRLDVEIKLQLIHDSVALLTPYTNRWEDNMDNMVPYLLETAQRHLSILTRYILTNHAAFLREFRAWYATWRQQVLLMFHGREPIVNNQRSAELLLAEALLPVLCRYLPSFPAAGLEITVLHKPVHYQMLRDLWGFALRSVTGDSAAQEVLVSAFRASDVSMTSDYIAQLNMAVGAPYLVRVRWGAFTTHRTLYDTTFNNMSTLFLGQDISRVFYTFVTAWDPDREDMPDGYSYADLMGKYQVYDGSEDKPLLQFVAVVLWLFLTENGAQPEWWNDAVARISHEQPWMEDELNIELVQGGEFARGGRVLGSTPVPLPSAAFQRGTEEAELGWAALHRFFTSETVWDIVERNKRRAANLRLPFGDRTAEMWQGLKQIYDYYMLHHGTSVARQTRVRETLLGPQGHAGFQPIVDIVTSYYPYRTSPRRRQSILRR